MVEIAMLRLQAVWYALQLIITPPGRVGGKKSEGVRWLLGGLDPKWHDAPPE